MIQLVVIELKVVRYVPQAHEAVDLRGVLVVEADEYTPLWHSSTSSRTYHGRAMDDCLAA
jgi:hypothetical protein